MLECARRLLLASVVGVVSSDSFANPVIGILIGYVFSYVFTKFEPFKAQTDSNLGVLLSYSVVLLFLAALLIKVDVTGDDADDQRTFGVLLLGILGSGPLATLFQLAQSATSISRGGGLAKLLEGADGDVPGSVEATQGNKLAASKKSLAIKRSTSGTPVTAIKSPVAKPSVSGASSAASSPQSSSDKRIGTSLDISPARTQPKSKSASRAKGQLASL